MRQSIQETVEALFALLHRPKPEPHVHVHKCGFDLNDPGARGCGCEWSHDGKATQALREADYDKAHVCPSCGKGPWLWQLTPETREEYKRRYNRAA